MSKRLTNLDSCYNVLRHITQPFVDEVITELSRIQVSTVHQFSGHVAACAEVADTVGYLCGRPSEVQKISNVAVDDAITASLDGLGKQFECHVSRVQDSFQILTGCMAVISEESSLEFGHISETIRKQFEEIEVLQELLGNCCEKIIDVSEETVGFLPTWRKKQCTPSEASGRLPCLEL